MANEQANQFVIGGFKPNSSGEIRVPKKVAIVKLLGGAIRIEINDCMRYELPTEEQRENLKKVFGIEVEVLEDGK